jgi:hypothetical protein
VPQERNIFKSLTVHENLTAVARPGAWTPERAYEMFPRLAERKGNLGTQLSGGEQQMLAMARALVLNPRLLLLDEPLEGLAPIIVDELLRAIQRVTRDEGMSAIIVEQHPQAILAISQQTVVLDHGTVVHQGPADALAKDAALLDRLLGVASVNPFRFPSGGSSKMFPRHAWYVAWHPRRIRRQATGSLRLRRTNGLLPRWCRPVPWHWRTTAAPPVHPCPLGRVCEGKLGLRLPRLAMGCDGKTVSMPSQRVDRFPTFAAFPALSVMALSGYGQEVTPAWQTRQNRGAALGRQPEWAYGGGLYHIACNYRLMVDNLMDLTHETYVHASSIGQKEIDDTPCGHTGRGRRG